MLIGGVPPTPYDLNFSLLRIPVRVHPLFWLVTLLLGMRLPTQEIILWIPIVFVSILVHEMGHALMIRRFGWWPSILLYTFGGLAMYQPTRHDSSKQMLISLAGPAAGFALAAILILAMKLGHHPVTFHLRGAFGLSWEWPPFENDQLNAAVEFLLFVNIWWGLINLLPVYPLDGGQCFRELLYSLRVPDAIVKSLWVSIFVAVAVAIYSVAKLHMYYTAAMFGYLAFLSFQALQSFTGRGGGYGGW
jgi:stage IV sporulation protein FB